MNINKLKALENYTILYAEDEKGTQEEIKEILELLFKKVYLASNGLEAFNLYESYKPDLIISDIKMPKLDGLSFLEKLRKNDENTQVAITTAFTNTDLLLKATELNLLKYLTKPINKTLLYELFEKFLNKKNKNEIVYLSKEYIFDKINLCILHEENTYNLNTKEILFLSLLLKKKTLVTYEELEDLLDTDNFHNENAIRQFVKKLRKKLPLNYLKNIQNQGYMISLEYK